MNDPADEIRQQMRNIRREMGADVKDIVDSARQLSDWRYYVRKYPWLCVGAAFVLGAVVAPTRRPRSGAQWDKLAEQFERARLSELGAAGSLSQSMLRKIIAVAGPIVARSAASYIASRLSASGDAHDPNVEPMGKPR